MCIDYLQKSLGVLRKNLIPFLIGSMALMLFAAAFFSLSVALIFKDPVPFLVSEYIDGSYFTANDTPMVIAGAFLFVLSVITIIVLQGGYYCMAIEGLSRKADLKTMIKGSKEKWKTIIGAFAVLGMIYAFIFTVSFIAIGYFLFSPMATVFTVLLIFAASVFFSFVYPAIAKGRGSIESIKASFGAARKNYIEALLLVLFFSFASFLLRSAIQIIPMGSIISYFLIYILIVPWETIAFSLFFIKNSGKR